MMMDHLHYEVRIAQHVSNYHGGRRWCIRLLPPQCNRTSHH